MCTRYSDSGSGHASFCAGRLGNGWQKRFPWGFFLVLRGICLFHTRFWYRLTKATMERGKGFSLGVCPERRCHASRAGLP